MQTLTIFTPTYNRINTLKRTYKSMKKQNCKDFIWMIIDDGSTDDTFNVVNSWILTEKEFTIKYIYKENGGMHTAHNVAYENIVTELNMCIDSDDCLADNAVEKILKKWNEIKHDGYAGIIGLDSDFNGNILGKEFNKDLKDTTLSGYYASGGCGDKKLIYKTEIIKKYPPYPVFKNEKYVALAYKYRLIDQTYKLAILNEVLCYVEYQKDGSSMNMLKQYYNNPHGFAFWRKICMEYPVSLRRCFVDCIHYVSSSIISKNRMFIKESPKKILTLMAIPFGVLLTFYIKIKVKQ